jgi:hypothetical protein
VPPEGSPHCLTFQLVLTFYRRRSRNLKTWAAEGSNSLEQILSLNASSYQLVKHFSMLVWPKFYYIFTKARNWTLLFAKRIYFTIFHYVSLRSILISSTYLCSLIPRYLFMFAMKTVHTFLISLTCVKSPGSVNHISMTNNFFFRRSLSYEGIATTLRMHGPGFESC